VRNIKVWGGTHADELRSIEVADSLQVDPIDGVSAGVVNLLARYLGKRQVGMNMVGAYRRIGQAPRFYEESRAPQVLAASQGFDAVIDLHDIREHGDDTAMIGTRGVSHQMLGFLAWMGITDLLQTDYSTLHEHVDNALLLEISPKGPRGSVARQREAFRYLAQTKELPTARASDFRWFRYIGDVAVQHMHPSQLQSGTRGFGALPDDIGEKIGHPGKAIHLQGWIDEPLAGSGIWAEVCTPIDTPDDTEWPLR
jgi:hypothetical protein